MNRRSAKLSTNLILVQNLFCSCAIGVQNLFCSFALFVPNLFCRGEFKYKCTLFNRERLYHQLALSHRQQDLIAKRPHHHRPSRWAKDFSQDQRKRHR